MANPHPDTPERSYMDDPNIKWRTVKPNYELVNEVYLKERTRQHAAGSLEKLVENLVKTWEMESTHKIDAQDWGTINQAKYKFRCNNIAPKDVEENIEKGNYQMMLEDSPLYNANKETNASSHALFKTAFPGAFAWELLDLYSGPPKVTFTWRHWAHWTGKYYDQEPTGELMELRGMCMAEVDDNLKIVDLQVYFDPHPMLGKMMGLSHEKKCPFSPSETKSE